MEFFFKLFIAINLMIAFCGCTRHADDMETKFYFTANTFGGKDFRENTGSCVYENGKVKKLYRYQVRTRVTKDGSKLIAFTEDRGKDIEIVDLKTNEIMKRFKHEQYPTEFRWFRDKTKVIMTAGSRHGIGPDITEEIYILDLDTMETKKITDYKEKNSIYAMDLSPDEKKVAYSVKRKKIDKLPIVKVIDLETKEEKILPFSALSFVWNPLNNKIILFGIYNDHKGDIEYGARLIVYDPETEKIVKKYPKDDSYSDMMWMTNSPDGKKIAYIRESKGRRSIWTMDPDGTNQKLVWNPGFFLRDLNWTK